ncbi:uncharacterized protein LOC108669803 [Hyalella azteca]|uniref:Alpha-1,3-mannosyl-glycoprotein 2-beta-N-acetylglucosaminyltransferase n=1 Tax=Hyalella azteca TaxID=294128 RepID=A0A8B7NGE7_HYAAZ|nr:uncharacterized protein LOC108669803 [Hyalella azteca]XP_047738615.1 uncharacterized protein LOC108669803 [Hyalella azteca]
MRIILTLCRLLLLAAAIVVGYYFVSSVVDFILSSGQKKVPELYIGNATRAELYHAEPPKEWLSVGAVLPNCGLPELCPEDHVPVSVSSHPSDMPRICIAGKFVTELGVNGGGRGINVAVVDPVTLQPVKARSFDTHNLESEALEDFLRDDIAAGQIVVLLTFDEASRNLSHHARHLIARLGSGQIQNLGYQDQWYMIGQEGIKGFTPYEQILGRGEDNSIAAAACVPKHVRGLPIAPDASLSYNAARATFCARRPYLQHLCSVTGQYEPVGVCEAPVSRGLSDSPLLRAPVLVLGQTDLPTLALTLQTLAAQSALVPRLVVVAFEPLLLPDARELAQLFNFSVLPVTDAANRAEFVERSMEHVAREYVSSSHVVILEEGAVLSPDFFPYVAAVLPLLAEPRAMAVSAWNPNGYSGVNGRASAVLRVSDTPRVAFVVTHHVLTQHLLTSRNTGSAGWESWVAGDWVAGGRLAGGGVAGGRLAGGGVAEKWVVVPEVSRVLVRPSAPHLQRLRHQTLVQQLFFRLRRTSLRYVEVTGVEQLRGDHYTRLLQQLLDRGDLWRVTAEEVRRCASNEKQLVLPTTSNNASAVVLPYRESAASETWSGLALLCRCFGLFDFGDSGQPKGLYQGILRFSINERDVLLLSDRSPFFAGSPHVAAAPTLP